MCWMCVKPSIAATAVYGLLSVLSYGTATADELALFDLYGGEEDVVMLATGSPMPVSKAPSVATVITAAQIKAMGAQDIEQVLEAVPGLHVSSYYQFDAPIYVFRGAYTVANPQVLVMVNGIRINSLFSGNMHNIWPGMPVEAISRIEVVRGPGAALYGADAFSGVINIITKSAQELEGTELGLRSGSFDTQDAWLVHGGEFAGIDTAVFLEYHKTDGFDATIERDAQSALDDATGTNVSLAPWPVTRTRENFDLRVDLNKGNWQWRSSVHRAKDLGLYGGVAEVLDPITRYAVDRFSSDLTWHDANFSEHWDVQLQLGTYHLDQKLDDGHQLVLYAPGSAPFGDVNNDNVPDILPDGLIGNPEFWERQYHYEVTTLFSGFEQHEIRLGFGRHYAELYKTRETKNFGVDPATGVSTLPLQVNSPIFDVSDTPYIYQPEVDRSNVHFYIQDVWNLASDWHLTTGVRHDDYSDFGSTTNPRVALVWWTSYNLTTKLMHGRAYRSPSAIEMYIQANPVVAGNPDLKPETIATTELAFDYRPTDALIYELNFFYYDWQDKIEVFLDVGAANKKAQNIGQQTGYGSEMAVEWQVRRDWGLLANYAFQQSHDERLNHDAGNAPHHQFYARSDWNFAAAWHWNLQLNWVGEREREFGDSRAPVPDYTTVDTKLSYAPNKAAWELAFISYNVFDSTPREPSLKGNPTAIPNDLPQGGRSVLLEARYKF